MVSVTRFLVIKRFSMTLYSFHFVLDKHKYSIQTVVAHGRSGGQCYCCSCLVGFRSNIRISFILIPVNQFPFTGCQIRRQHAFLS